MDNKKEQTELKATNIISLFQKATNIISLFHPKKKIFFVKKAGCHFGFLKKAGRHQKGAGRRALQKRPRQNTVIGTCLNSLDEGDSPSKFRVSTPALLYKVLAQSYQDGQYICICMIVV